MLANLFLGLREAEGMLGANAGESAVTYRDGRRTHPERLLCHSHPQLSALSDQIPAWQHGNWNQKRIAERAVQNFQDGIINFHYRSVWKPSYYIIIGKCGDQAKHACSAAEKGIGMRGEISEAK